jgi:hypothetical protein
MPIKAVLGSLAPKQEIALCLSLPQRDASHLTFFDTEVRILQVEVRKETDDADHIKGPGDHPD